MTLSRGTHDGADLRIAIVASRFNELVTDRLVHGALDALKRSGVPRETIDLAWVPGSFELPQIAKRQALSGNYDAVICLGAVIRGETAHFDFVAAEAAAGINAVALETGVPVIFGVLTTDTVQQALDRSGGKAGNKGTSSAEAAIEMATLIRSLL